MEVNRNEVFKTCEKFIKEYEGWDWGADGKELFKSLKENLKTYNIDILLTQFKVLLAWFDESGLGLTKYSKLRTIIFWLEEIKLSNYPIQIQKELF